MTLSAQQYICMRALFRSVLAANSPLVANPSDGEVLGFFNQLIVEAGGASALPAVQQSAIGYACRGLLSGNFSGVSNPSDADVLAFWAQLKADSGGAPALTVSRYQVLKGTLLERVSLNYPGASNPSLQNLLGYFGAGAVLGPVATRCYIPELNTAGANVPWNVRTGHFLRCTGGVTGLQVEWPNFYVAGGFAEQSAGTMTINVASIEYPAGTFTRIKFAGTNSVSFAAGTRQLCDVCPVPMPNGSLFWVKWQWQNSFGIVFGTQGQMHSNAFMGDCVEQSAVDRTMTAGGDVDSNPGVNMWPCAILGQTSDRTLVFFGDSRTVGFGDTPDASGDLGQLARPFGATYAYLNCGASGDNTGTFLTGNANRVALANYGTTVVNALGINDLRAGVTAAALEAQFTTIRGSVPGKQFWNTTVTPDTTGAWTLADGSDQTINGTSAPQLQLLNAATRAGSYGGTGFLDLASFLEHATVPSKWKADGTPAKYTADGLHPTQFGYKQIVLSLP